MFALSYVPSHSWFLFLSLRGTAAFRCGFQPLYLIFLLRWRTFISHFQIQIFKFSNLFSRSSFFPSISSFLPSELMGQHPCAHYLQITYNRLKFDATIFSIGIISLMPLCVVLYFWTLYLVSLISLVSYRSTYVPSSETRVLYFYLVSSIRTPFCGFNPVATATPTPHAKLWLVAPAHFTACTASLQVVSTGC